MGDRPVYKKDWVLTTEALEKLLACLDSDSEQAGQKLLEIRRRLQMFFECNHCYDPDRLIDITIDRGARRIYEGVEVRDPSSYLGKIARFVLKEQWAEKSIDQLDEERLDSSPPLISSGQDEDEADELEARLACLEECAGKLVPAERQRVIDYYSGNRRAKIDNRKRMADELRTTPGNLRVRMHRTREKLENCILECMKKRKQI